MATSERISDERVREWAAQTNLIWPQAMSWTPLINATEDRNALAREVLALREQRDAAVAIAREAVDGMAELLTGEVPAPDLDTLRARLAQIGGKD